MTHMEDGVQSAKLQQIASNRLVNDSSPQANDISRHGSELGKVGKNPTKPYSAKLTLNQQSTRASSRFAWQGLN